MIVLILVIGILAGAIGTLIINEAIGQDKRSTESNNVSNNSSVNNTKINESKNDSTEKNSSNKVNSNYVGEAQAKKSAIKFLYDVEIVDKGDNIKITNIGMINIEGKPFYKVSWKTNDNKGYLTVYAYDRTVWGEWY